MRLCSHRILLRPYHPHNLCTSIVVCTRHFFLCMVSPTMVCCNSRCCGLHLSWPCILSVWSIVRRLMHTSTWCTSAAGELSPPFSRCASITPSLSLSQHAQIRKQEH